MLSAMKQFGITRLLASCLFGAVLVGCVYGSYQGWNSEGYRIQGAMDLSGEWEFYNGKYSPYEALAMPFYQKVEVPKPLPKEIKAQLAEEYWYRKRFTLPKFDGPLAISFGTIKGEHEVYWNGRYLGAGGKTGIAVYRIPADYLVHDQVTVAVRVKRYQTLFPGIVHLNSVLLGDAEKISQHQQLYYSENGLKPILLGTIKLVFTFLFSILFLATPRKREYLPFALFALFSAGSVIVTSKFLPIYEDYQFKNSLQFICSALSLAMIPFVTSAFLRISDEYRSYARSFGFGAPLVFVLAAIIVKTEEQRLAVFRLSNEWLPLLIGIPAVIACAVCYRRLDGKLKHRKRQILVFGVSLLLGVCLWGDFASKLYSFQHAKYFGFVDFLIFVGLAASLVLDFRVISNRSERAGKSVPKWFAGFLVTGTKAVQFEISMVVIAVDTIAYTKKLAAIGAEEKDSLHKEIRDLLHPLTAIYGAQKLSDGGDGGLFAWDTPPEASRGWEEIMAGVRYIAQVHGSRFGVQFRVGMAAGQVRCEMRESDFSFMGEALNAAARLESMSQPGEPLVDLSVMGVFGKDITAEEWVEAELKGVVYRGKPLKLAA